MQEPTTTLTPVTSSSSGFTPSSFKEQAGAALDEAEKRLAKARTAVKAAQDVVRAALTHRDDCRRIVRALKPRTRRASSKAK